MRIISAWTIRPFLFIVIFTTVCCVTLFYGLRQSLSDKNVLVTGNESFSALSQKRIIATSTKASQPHGGISCSKYGTTGFHAGTYIATYSPNSAPNGSIWSWRECAERCALSAVCEFWALQLDGQKECLLMKNQGAYYDTGGHSEGDKDESCLPPKHKIDGEWSGGNVGGSCSKYGTTGWHAGTYIATFAPKSAPDGLLWSWRECAKECALLTACEFWTLQLDGQKQCSLMKNQGTYYDVVGHYEGNKDESCLLEKYDDSHGGWSFSWSDEFNESEIDTSVWGHEIGYLRNAELQYYSSRTENSRIENNQLLIEARTDSWNGHEVTSASLTTKGKRSFLYGRFSIRAKIDVRQGSWPAWWWIPDSGGWPRGGEIDMMEYFQRRLLFNVMDGNSQWTKVARYLDDFGGDSFANEFHVWTWEWTKERIKLYQDGALMSDYDVSSADGTGPGGENPFRRPGHLVLNQAIGGTAGGDPSRTEFPVKYHIDWIRVWEWNEITTGVRLDVNNGSGSGTYKIGTKATIAAAPAPVGMTFANWTIDARDHVMLDDTISSHTTLTIPSSGASATAWYKPLENQGTEVNLFNSSSAKEPDSHVSTITNYGSGRRIYAKITEQWEYGVGAAAGAVWPDQLWKFQETSCPSSTGNPCYLIINDDSSRILYATSGSDNESGVGAIIPGEHTWDDQKWFLMETVCGFASCYFIINAHSQRHLFAMNDCLWEDGFGAIANPNGSDNERWFVSF